MMVILTAHWSPVLRRFDVVPFGSIWRIRLAVVDPETLGENSCKYPTSLGAHILCGDWSMDSGQATARLCPARVRETDCQKRAAWCPKNPRVETESGLGSRPGGNRRVP